MKNNEKNTNEKRAEYNILLRNLKEEVERFAIMVSRKTAEESFSSSIKKIEEEVKKKENRGTAREDFYAGKVKELTKLEERLSETSVNIAITNPSSVKSYEQCYKEQMKLVWEEVQKLDDDSSKKSIIEKIEEIRNTQREKKESEQDFYCRQFVSIQAVKKLIKGTTVLKTGRK